LNAGKADERERLVGAFVDFIEKFCGFGSGAVGFKDYTAVKRVRDVIVVVHVAEKRGCVCYEQVFHNRVPCG
jgi:hypothetical protein